MKLSQRRAPALVALFAPLAALALAGCGSTAPETTQTGGADGPPIEKVVIAVAGTPALDQLVVLRWQQQLEEAGVEVELAQMEASDVALRVVIAGQADMYTGSFAPMIRAIQETDADLRTVVVDSGATNYVFSAQPEFDDLEDLEGATVGINRTGDATESVVRATMSEAGFDPDTVNFVQIGGGGARVSALLAGQVDVVPVSIDQSIVLETQGYPSVAIAADYLTDFFQNGLIMRADYIADNQEGVQWLVDQYIDAQRWAASDQEGWIELSRTVDDTLTDEQREATYQRLLDIGIFAVDGGLQQEKIDSYLRIAEDTGLLVDPPPGDVWSDPSFVEDYLERNGTFEG